MSFLNDFYDKIKGLVVNENMPSLKEMPPKDNQHEKPQYEYICKQCENYCSQKCECRCHVTSCEECDKSLCNFKICKCDCHGIHSVEQLELLEKEIPIVKSQKEISNSNHPTPISPPTKEIISEFALTNNQNKEKFLFPNIDKSETKIESQNTNENILKSINEQGKVKIEILTNQPINKISHKSLDTNNQPNKNIPELENLKEEKKEVYLRRLSKYSHVLFHNEADNLGKTILSAMKGSNKNNRVKKYICFRSKSIEKSYRRMNYEKKYFQDDKEYLESLTIPLYLKMKAQFDRVKLEDLKKPDKIDNYVDEKFIRNKSQIAKNLEKLTRELKFDNYNDKFKLSLNIIEDLEKQDSWQSYSSLLFADLANVDEKLVKKLTINKTMGLTKSSTFK